MRVFEYLYESIYLFLDTWGSPYGVMIKVLECDRNVNEFELQSHFHFRMNKIGKV